MFNTVIIGCGNIAGGFDTKTSIDEPLTHAGAFTQHGGFDVIACCDPDVAKRQAFQEQWQIPFGADCPEELDVGDLSIDVVSLCSPTVLHGLHLETVFGWQPGLLFCEKPITQNTEEAAEWVQRYAAAGIPFAVNHTRRWAPDICALKEEFAQQKWGKIRSVSCTYNKGILNNGCHMVDLLHYLLGTLRLIAAGAEVYDFWPDDPSIPALLETQGGIPVTLNVGHAQDYSLFEAQFITERGVLNMEAGGMVWSQRTVIDDAHFAGYRSLGKVSVEEGSGRAAMAGAVKNIYQALVEGAALSSTGFTALQAQRVCQQIRQCAQTQTSYSEVSA